MSLQGGSNRHVAFRRPSKKKKPGKAAHVNQAQLTRMYVAEEHPNPQQAKAPRATGMTRFARRFGQFGIAPTSAAD